MSSVKHDVPVRKRGSSLRLRGAPILESVVMGSISLRELETASPTANRRRAGPYPTICYTRPVRDHSAPLSGLVVLDLTRVLAGPYCTRLLADLGARVIKIERPGMGDEMRRAPLQLEPQREDQSTYFVRVNVGKESVGLDLAHPAAHAEIGRAHV